MSRIICTVYRSAKHEGMYLYVKKSEELSRVPEDLLKRFGKAEFAMTLLLEEGKKLARAELPKVMAAIEESGFYLQLPPPREPALQPREDR